MIVDLSADADESLRFCGGLWVAWSLFVEKSCVALSLRANKGNIFLSYCAISKMRLPAQFYAGSLGMTGMWISSDDPWLCCASYSGMIVKLLKDSIYWSSQRTSHDKALAAVAEIKKKRSP